MRAGSMALAAAAVFFAGVLVGGRGVTREAPPPTPVVLVDAESGFVQPTPRTSPLGVEEVPREVDEGTIEEYDEDVDDDDRDSSGPGSGREEEDEREERDEDDSGPGSGREEEDEREERDEDDSGPGSDDSGPGSDNSGSDDDDD